MKLCQEQTVKTGEESEAKKIVELTERTGERKNLN